MRLDLLRLLANLISWQRSKFHQLKSHHDHGQQLIRRYLPLTLQPTPFYFVKRLRVIHLTNQFYSPRLTAPQIVGLSELVQL